MTDHTTKQLQRRRNLLSGKKRKKRVLLLALILILGSGAFLFHKGGFYALSEILTWLQQNKPEKVVVSTPDVSPRGDIYDRNFRRLAATYETSALYARPLEMEDPSASAGILAEILGLEQNKLLATLKGERGFVWIAKGIDENLAETIKARNIKGVYQVVETKRSYPNNETAAHAVGFVENGQGLDGIEFKYNTLLRGDETNTAELEKLHFNPTAAFSRDTTHLVLNLDLMIQTKIERFLEKRARITGASTGAVLIMDANSGSIIAMASYPAFNPNRYWEFPSSALNNHAVTEPVYPGELSLIFQQAAAINSRNERRSQVLESLTTVAPVPVIEPETFKRRKVSSAPPVGNVDPEYLVRFAELLGFGQKPLTDIPLKDEVPVSASLLLTDHSFHSSALRLLTAFTTLVNNGRIVSPHLLGKAYPKENPTPVETSLNSPEQAVSLHPATSKDLTDFLAAKWLRLSSKDDSLKMPMFFETHRLANGLEDSGRADHGEDAGAEIAPSPRITQSLMLGAIPGRNPKLTMIGFLSYHEQADTISPRTLESFGDKFSVLSPDQDMIQKMLYVAEQPSLVPSPDFWANGGTALAAGLDPLAPKEGNPAGSSAVKKNMPDVTGKSLRAGLQVLQHYNVEIKLVGSGRIITQQPAAGAKLKSGTVCVLEMQQEI